MKIYKHFSKIFMFVLCIGIILIAELGSINAVEKNSEIKENAEVVNESYINENEPFRGVWISTVYKIDYPDKDTIDSEELKKNSARILDDCKNMGFNAVIFQVRPTADSFYKSSLFPWSKWISGKEGTAPNNDFDPLEYWVTEAHKRGMEFHAWINPFRVTTPVSEGTDILSGLSDKNVVKSNPDYVVKHKDANNRESYYINPAIPEARQFVIDGALEIVNNYDVDGIHIDDYFYPDKDFEDDKDFEKYGSGFSSKDDWRRDNINSFIKEMNRQLHEADSDIQFGISPSGIWANKSSNPLGSDTTGMESYSSVYADSRLWVKEGWIDYIAPQIYWSVGQKGSDYSVLLNWWSNVVKDTRVKLYIGLADYKTVDADSGNAFYDGNEIQKQMSINEKNDIIKGEIHFAYNSIKKVPKLQNKIIAQYTKKSEESSQNSDIKVIVDGKEVMFDQKPIIENSRTLVPMRAIFETLGTSVEWFSETQSIVSKDDEKVITMKIGDKKIYINERETIVLDVAPKIVNSRTLVPLRAVSEAFDAKVDWNGELRIVTVTTNKIKS